MEKTYKFILPQNKEVKGTKVRIENGEVFVDVEFKEKFEPKDGDFCVLGYRDNDGSCYWISIIKEFRRINDVISTTDYVSQIFIADGNQSDCLNDIQFNGRTTAAEEARSATPEEKAAFLERLEKECGKRWNAEKKCLEDIRWRAEKGEIYYYISAALGIDISKDNDVRGDFSEMRHKSNNYFRTHKAAQEVAYQIKEIFKNSKAE